MFRLNAGDLTKRFGHAVPVTQMVIALIAHQRNRSLQFTSQTTNQLGLLFQVTIEIAEKPFVVVVFAQTVTNTSRRTQCGFVPVDDA